MLERGGSLLKNLFVWCVEAIFALCVVIQAVLLSDYFIPIHFKIPSAGQFILEKVEKMDKLGGEKEGETIKMVAYWMVENEICLQI